MRRGSRRFWSFLAIFAGSVAGAAAAAPPAYTIEKLALEGDPAPGGGVVSQIYGAPSIDALGRVAFSGRINDGPTNLGAIFVGSQSGLVIGAVQGQTAPGTGGAAFGDVARPGITSPDRLAYVGIYDAGGQFFVGAFSQVDGIGNALLLPGDAAPGGGTFGDAFGIHGINEAGDVAIGGTVSPVTGGALETYFFADNTGVQEVARQGNATPIGGVYSGIQSFFDVALAADGTVTFTAPVTGGSAIQAIFQWQSGVVTPLYRVGDAWPPGGTGSFSFLGQQVGGNAAGDLAFNADVSVPGEFPSERVFVRRDGVLREVIRRDDPVPGTTPPLFFQGLSGSTPPELDANGTVVFAATLDDANDTHFGRSLLVEGGGVISVLALGGEVVPGVPGAVFTDFTEARSNESGQIGFTAFTTGGVGIFLATPVAVVPAIGPWGFGVLTFLVVGFAARVRQRG